MGALSWSTSTGPLWTTVTFEVLLSLVLVSGFSGPDLPVIMIITMVDSVSTELLNSPDVSVSRYMGYL